MDNEELLTKLLERLDLIANVLTQILEQHNAYSQSKETMSPDEAPETITQEDINLMSRKITVESWKKQFGEDKVAEWLSSAKQKRHTTI